MIKFHQNVYSKKSKHPLRKNLRKYKPKTLKQRTRDNDKLNHKDIIKELAEKKDKSILFNWWKMENRF